VLFALLGCTAPNKILNMLRHIHQDTASLSGRYQPVFLKPWRGWIPAQHASAARLPRERVLTHLPTTLLVMCLLLRLYVMPCAAGCLTKAAAAVSREANIGQEPRPRYSGTRVPHQPRWLPTGCSTPRDGMEVLHHVTVTLVHFADTSNRNSIRNRITGHTTRPRWADKLGCWSMPPTCTTIAAASAGPHCRRDSACRACAAAACNHKPRLPRTVTALKHA
jgi:hypothetical protein